MRKLLKSVVYRGNYIWLWKCSKLKIVRGWKSIRGRSVICVYLVLIFFWALLMGTCGVGFCARRTSVCPNRVILRHMHNCTVGFGWRTFGFSCY